jgi:hypothetical protein
MTSYKGEDSPGIGVKAYDSSGRGLAALPTSALRFAQSRLFSLDKLLFRGFSKLHPRADIAGSFYT